MYVEAVYENTLKHIEMFRDFNPATHLLNMQMS